MLNQARRTAEHSLRRRGQAESLITTADKIPEPSPDRERLDAEMEDRKYWAACRALLDAARIPVRYAKADLDNLGGLPDDVRERYTSAAKRLRLKLHDPGIVALVGNRGPGKTWMGCGLVRIFCRAKRSARYLTAMDYFIQLKGTYDDGTGGDSEAAVESRHIRPQLLVIDEVHERGNTDWEDRMLTRLIDKRYAANLTTLLISNQTKKDFAERVGPSISDRIRDGGGVIVCDWPSLRGRIGQ